MRGGGRYFGVADTVPCRDRTYKWLRYSKCEREFWEDNQTLGGACDSVTGEALSPKEVQEGCDEEMGFLKKMHVWDQVNPGAGPKIPIWENMGHAMGVRKEG